VGSGGLVLYGTTTSAWSYMLTPDVLLQREVVMVHYGTMAYAGAIRFSVYIFIIYTPYPSCLGRYHIVTSVRTGGITFVPIVQRGVCTQTEQHCLVCVHRRDFRIYIYTIYRVVYVYMYILISLLR